MSSAYYNENDAHAAGWLRNLVAAGHLPAGTVDDRSILDVEPGDLDGFTECHFFAGIGGWGLALELAGWPADRPVWTGSCPCQPFSSAGKQSGAADERHLWPQWLRLIRECRPHVVFGEQVAGAVGFGWLDRVFADLEAIGYACGAAVLGAHSVNAPHIRQRLFWVADRDGERRDGFAVRLQPGQPRQAGFEAAGCGATGGLADADEPRPQGGLRGRQDTGREDLHRRAGCGGATGGLADAGISGGRWQPREQQGWRSIAADDGESFWDAAVWLPCLDGKARRALPSFQPLVDARGCICGLRLGQDCACAEKPSRVGMLRGAGNAISPPVAAVFIRAFMDAANAKSI